MFRIIAAQPKGVVFSGRVAQATFISRRCLSAYIKLSSRVKEALANNEPVVALESTIISHGMPYPQNVETARAVEGVVSKYGSTAATVALMDGKVH
ncbi:hypothetical protein EV175_004577, partial [Coemansia sp. RSA 1933]